MTRRLLGAPKGGYGSDWWGAEPLLAEQLDYAAYDAVALLRPARPRARSWREAFGCTAQVLAASRTACIEAFRRLPQPSTTMPGTAACGLIDGARGRRSARARGGVIRRLPLASWQRSELRERYAGRRLALAA